MRLLWGWARTPASWDWTSLISRFVFNSSMLARATASPRRQPFFVCISFKIMSFSIALFIKMLPPRDGACSAQDRLLITSNQRQVHFFKSTWKQFGVAIFKYTVLSFYWSLKNCFTDFLMAGIYSRLGTLWTRGRGEIGIGSLGTHFLTFTIWSYLYIF